MKKFLLFLLLAFPMLGLAQNARVDDIVFARSGNPAPAAQVAVCSQVAITAISESLSTVTVTTTLNPPQGSTVTIVGVTPTQYNGSFVVVTTSGTNFTYVNPTQGLGAGTVFGSVLVTSTAPCSPLANLCSSYTDTTCASPNPVTADGLGNYSFFVKPGHYARQFYGTGLTAKTQTDQVFPCDPSSNCTISGALTAQNINDKLNVGSAPRYANEAAAVTAAGLTNKTIIETGSSYSGTDCAANQANLFNLDYRGNSTPCNTNNTLAFNNNDGSVWSGARLNFVPSTLPANVSTTAFWSSTYAGGTFAGAGSLVDGFAATAFTTGADSGTLPNLRGAELACSVQGSGGTVTVCEGASFYAAGNGSSTTTIGTARSADFLGCHGQTYGVAPTHCSGGDFESQQAKASGTNYAARFFGIIRVAYDTGITAGGIDLDDTSNTPHTFIKMDSGNSASFNAPNGNGILFRDSGFVTRFSVQSGGLMIGSGTDTNITRDSAGVIDFGNGALNDVSGTLQAATYGRGAASGTPAALTITGQAGTGTNIVGGKVGVQPGAGTGNAAAAQVDINRDIMAASGTSAQSQVSGMTVCESKTLSNTSNTNQQIAVISLPSNSAGGAEGVITVTCTDGTNFDAETQSFNVSFVNKAGAFTLGTPAITASTAANNSGSCTVGMNVAGASSQIFIKVQPVFTTIVPTTVTSYITLRNNGPGSVTCQ